jgi:hypothetical protein
MDLNRRLNDLEKRAGQLSAPSAGLIIVKDDSEAVGTWHRQSGFDQNNYRNSDSFRECDASRPPRPVKVLCGVSWEDL